jgi:hypothetical protein
MIKNLVPLYLIFLAACSASTTATATLEATATPTESLPPTPTVHVLPTEPIPTPNYLQSEADSFEAELNQVFALRDGQSVHIPSEDLTITHTTRIEFECPLDAECEVPLIATDNFQVAHRGEPLGYSPWDPVMEFGDYVLTTARFYSGYDYNEHQFEIILSVERQDAVAAKAQTRQAQVSPATISSNCGSPLSQYVALQPETLEAHMIAVYESSSGPVDVYVERTAAPIILILSAGESTDWNLHLAEDVSLEKIILNGANPHTLVGVEDTPVIDRSDPVNNIMRSVYLWSASDLGYENGLAPAWVYQIESLAGVPLNTFSGCHKASEFTIR